MHTLHKMWTCSPCQCLAACVKKEVGVSRNCKGVSRYHDCVSLCVKGVSLCVKGVLLCVRGVSTCHECGSRHHDASASRCVKKQCNVIKQHVNAMSSNSTRVFQDVKKQSNVTDALQLPIAPQCDSLPVCVVKVSGDSTRNISHIDI